MGLTPWKCFRKLKDKPYPKSRFNRSVPDAKLKIMNTGARAAHVDTFPCSFSIISKSTCRVSSESLEAARVAANRVLVRNCGGKTEFHLVMSKVPHDACRLNKMLSVAGADRLQSGMRKSFGKCQRRAARIAKDDVILTVRTYAKYKPAVFRAFRTATLKLPMATLSQENSNWGLTKIDREDYVRLRNEKKIIPQGSNVMYMNNKGPLSENFMKLAAAKPFQNTQASMKFSKNEVSDLQRPFRKFSLVAAQ